MATFCLHPFPVFLKIIASLKFKVFFKSYASLNSWCQYTYTCLINKFFTISSFHVCMYIFLLMMTCQYYILCPCYVQTTHWFDNKYIWITRLIWVIRMGTRWSHGQLLHEKRLRGVVQILVNAAIYILS